VVNVELRVSPPFLLVCVVSLHANFAGMPTNRCIGQEPRRRGAAGGGGERGRGRKTKRQEGLRQQGIQSVGEDARLVEGALHRRRQRPRQEG